MSSNGRWLRWTVLLGEEGGVYIPEISLTVAFSNRLWKWISTGGCYMTTANVNAGGCHKPTASANVTFTQAVVIWRLIYDNRMWKWIFTGDYKVVAHLFLYTADPKVKPPVKKKEDRRLKALFYRWGELTPRHVHTCLWPLLGIHVTDASYVRSHGWLCLASGVRRPIDLSSWRRRQEDDARRVRWAFRQRVVRVHVDWSFVWIVVQGPSAISLDGQLGGKGSDACGSW
jgi:hypothetical protein